MSIYTLPEHAPRFRDERALQLIEQALVALRENGNRWDIPTEAKAVLEHVRANWPKEYRWRTGMMSPDREGMIRCMAQLRAHAQGTTSTTREHAARRAGWEEWWLSPAEQQVVRDYRADTIEVVA